MTSPVADASVYTDPSGLAALKRDARAQDPNAVREVAKQFESIFAKMVLSSMRQASSSFGDDLFGSDQQKFYQGMFDDQLAVELTKGRGLGLADMLVQQLTRAGMVPADAAGGAGGANAVRGANASSAANTANAASTSSGPASGAADVAGKKGGLPFSAPVSAGMKRSFPIAAASGAKSTLHVDSSSSTASDASASRISPEQFVKELWPCAEEAGKELGVDPRHLIAQAALETGWGKSLPCDTNGNTSFNLFGIKAGDSWSGDSVSVRTLEFEGGVPMPKMAKFRSYESAAESFRDYVALLRDNPRYAEALNTGSDTTAFANALQRGGYATDPAYAQKISTISQNLRISETSLKSSAEAPMTPLIATF
jgi:peptidoglycan hydrolase FlgJ